MLHKRDPSQPSTLKVPLIITVCLVVVGLAVFLVVGNKKTTTDLSTSRTATFIAPSTTTKTYTDTAHKFSFKYPDNWDTDFVGKGATDGPVAPDPDWNKVSRPVIVVPKSGYKNNAVSVNTYCNAETIDQYRKNKDDSHTQTDLKVNGYAAFYDKHTYKDGNESYLTHTYVIIKGESCLQISYRENWKDSKPGRTFDDSGNMPGYETIVNSVKFN